MQKESHWTLEMKQVRFVDMIDCLAVIHRGGGALPARFMYPLGKISANIESGAKVTLH